MEDKEKLNKLRKAYHDLENKYKGLESKFGVSTLQKALWFIAGLIIGIFL